VTVVEDATITVDVDNAEVCGGGSALLTATVSGGSSLLTLRWQSSPDNSTWSNIDGETSATLVAQTSTPGTTWYRVVVTDPNAACDDPVSNSVSVTVVPDAAISVLLDNAEVCVDGLVTLTADISGGSSALQLQWQSSPDDATWTSIPGATDTTYVADTSVPGSTYYRVVATDTLSDCSDPTSASVLVLVVPDATVTVTLDNAEVCVGGSVELTANLVGGSSALQLQWQSSPDDATWTNIPGATDTTFSAPTTSADVTYYQVIVTDTLSGCSDPVSNSVQVTVVEDATVSIGVNNAEVCIGGDVTLVGTVTGGSSALQLQWQWSPDNSTWTNIPGATNDTLIADTSTPDTTWYQLVVTDTLSDCSDPVSNAIQVIVVDGVSATIAVDNPEVCVGGTALLTATITGGSGSATYQWESSSDSATWTPIPGETGTTLLANTTTAGLTFYRIVISDPSSSCPSSAFGGVSVLVVDDASISIAVDNAEVCIGGNATLVATITGGSSALQVQWQSSPDNTTWTDIPGATNDTLIADTGTAGLTWYQAVVTDTLSDCTDPVSGSVSVLVVEDATVTVGVDNAEVCVGGTAVLTATVTNGSSGVTY
ncbi:MAG: hypothetical protein R3330_10060, partial [Saprospiraceae bacterium]|nr:hypothetical protein [Saprospiraceae bacterium]